MGGAFWADQSLEALPQNTNTNSKPSGLRITDMRVLTVARAPMACPLIRIDTNQVIYGLGEVRDGASKNYALMLKSCSYLIYSEAFDNLPAPARQRVYRRLWKVLSGSETSSVFASLSADDRQAILEILRDTKFDLPDYWHTGAIAARVKAIADFGGSLGLITSPRPCTSVLARKGLVGTTHAKSLSGNSVINISIQVCKKSRRFMRFSNNTRKVIEKNLCTDNTSICESTNAVLSGIRSVPWIPFFV